MVWPFIVASCAAVIAALTGAALLAERRRTQRLSKENRVLSELAGAVTGTDWQQGLEAILQTLVQSAVCQGAILLALTDHGNLECRATVEASGMPSWDGALAAGARHAMERRTPVYLDGDGYLPVMADGELLGILALRGASDVCPVSAAAMRLVALCLNGMKLYQRQTALSNTDGLTGLANHRHFQQTLSIALGQTYLEGLSLSMILLDIDHFKSVNDTYGHLFGDMVLREIAGVLRRVLPPDTLAARYGGEEMVVLLQGELAGRCEEIAERLRAAIEAHEIFDFSTGTRLHVTVSLGAAVYEMGQGKSRLIARADEALYTSKREGRNRVTVAPSETSTSPLIPT